MADFVSEELDTGDSADSGRGGVVRISSSAEGGRKLLRGVDYAPDSFESDEHGTGEYGDSADSGRGGRVHAGDGDEGGRKLLHGDAGEDHDVAEAINYMASLPECVFKSNHAAACLVQSWLPVLLPGIYGSGAIQRKAKEEHGDDTVQAALILAGEEDMVGEEDVVREKENVAGEEEEVAVQTKEEENVIREMYKIIFPCMYGEKDA